MGRVGGGLDDSKVHGGRLIPNSKTGERECECHSSFARPSCRFEVGNMGAAVSDFNAPLSHLSALLNDCTESKA